MLSTISQNPTNDHSHRRDSGISLEKAELYIVLYRVLMRGWVGNT